MTKRVYEVQLEIGHKATPLNRKQANGYTHKWTAFVRGANNTKIEHCIQRVVFQLHTDFPDPNREITEPPYQVKETGYAGFDIPIQVYFKNKEKPNHVVYTHNLFLLTEKPNDSTRIEKVKFMNPSREFEKCLIKCGAQLLNVSVKKERSNSPPAKKYKSSSLIPSKELSKPPHSSSSHHHHSKSSQHNRNSHHNHGLHDNGTSVSSNQTSTKQHHQPSKQSSQLNKNLHNSNNHDSGSSNHSTLSNNLTSTKQHHQPEQSREFLDVFGAPLIYNNKLEGKPEGKVDIKSEFKLDIKSETKADLKSEAKIDIKPEVKIDAKIETKYDRKYESKIEVKAEGKIEGKTEGKKSKDNDSYLNLQLVQSKISCLTDCDRLQKIVDIVEEAGEWFNLTPKKFEFDLKRLDKRTLSKIEKCLQL